MSAPSKPSATPPHWRALPRVFVPGAELAAGEPFELPSEEYARLAKVLRLGTGDPVALLPDDGTVWTARLQGRSAVPEAVERPQTDARRPVLLAQAVPKPEKLEEVVRMGTELGVAGFRIFVSDRTVARWDADKRAHRLNRLAAIAREAAEVCGRTRLPELRWAEGLDAVFHEFPEAIVLSEAEGLDQGLEARLDALPPEAASVLVIGPEGGWSPAEVRRIAGREATLGPRVLRVDTAAAAAAARALARRG